MGGVVSGLGAIAGVVAAPFTGGASLLLTGASVAQMVFAPSPSPNVVPVDYSSAIAEKEAQIKKMKEEEEKKRQLLIEQSKEIKELLQEKENMSKEFNQIQQDLQSLQTKHGTLLERAKQDYSQQVAKQKETILHQYLLSQFKKENAQISKAMKKIEMMKKSCANELRYFSKDQITRVNMLGAGATAQVYSGFLKLKQEEEPIMVAIKEFFSCQAENSTHTTSMVFSEALAMSHLEHPNIIQLIGVCSATKSIIMEYFAGMDLSYLLNLTKKQNSILTVKDKITILQQAAMALEYLHQNGVIHKDIKGGNLLVSVSENNNQIVAKLTDFGLADWIYKEFSVPNTSTHSVSKVLQTRRVLFSDKIICDNFGGTINYVSPELVKPEFDENFKSVYKYSFGSDVYSFGVLMMECICEQVPYGEVLHEESIKAMICAGQLPFCQADLFKQGVSEELVNCIWRCCEKEVKKRPTMTQIVNCLKQEISKL